MSPRLLLLIPFFGLLGACSSLSTHPKNIYKPIYVEEGVASWYGGRDIGRITASGEYYHRSDYTAANKTLPFNSIVRVTNLANGKSVIVRINDRGPYIRGRMIDLTLVPATQIGMIESGLTRVRMEVLKPIPLLTRSNLRATPKLSTKSENPYPNTHKISSKSKCTKTTAARHTKYSKKHHKKKHHE